MTQRTDPLLSRQNRPEMMALLHAMSVCHSRAQRLDNLRMALSIAISVVGAVVAFTGVSSSGVTAVGALWAVVNAIGLGSWSTGQLRRAATLQEMFDVRLFELPWNAVAAGEPLGAEEVSRLDRAYRETSSTSATTTRCHRCPARTTCSPASSRTSGGVPGCADATRTPCSPGWRSGRRWGSSSR